MKSYEEAKERYAQYGVDTDGALEALAKVSISLHCWQGDDVCGFESDVLGLGGDGIQTTGNYPGKARTGDELRSDLECAHRQIPGGHRLNLHALYAETDGKAVDRNELQPEHFSRWIDWAGEKGIGLDFNPSLFSHPKTESGFTLASSDEGLRRFWVEHCVACRRIGEAMGRAQGSPCVVDVWIPDGYKDIPMDRATPRQILNKSLDEVFAEPIDKAFVLDALEGKLFGIGTESYVVGSHEFYLSYAVRNNKLLCLDAGHFHPTETISDKISSVMTFLDEILLHVSRGVRWDSDHVVILNDDLRAIAEEIVRGGYLDRVHIGLDFFDASINRVAAWVIGTRAMIKALLIAMLEPADMLRKLETGRDYTGRLAMMEAFKTMPFSAVWDHYCLTKNVPVGTAWLDDVRTYERDELSKRS